MVQYVSRNFKIAASVLLVTEDEFICHAIFFKINMNLDVLQADVAMNKKF